MKFAESWYLYISHFKFYTYEAFLHMSIIYKIYTETMYVCVCFCVHGVGMAFVCACAHA